MKKLVVTLCLAALSAAVLVSPALALPPFSKEFTGKYVEGNKNGAFVKAVGEAKCNVCHDAASKSKKDKNEYGKVVGKFLSKADFDKVKTDMEAAKKFIQEGLAKAEAEKTADGKTYGERIKAGTLPSGG
jgi:tRNA U54 and U55 pseudouridine synthase Pus10